MAWLWMVIAIVVVVVVALVAVGARQRRTAMLRERFGPEYDRAVESSDDRRAAEAGLRDRERQRARFDVEPLPEADRLRFAREWRDLQERFVDQPAPAAAAADALVTRVMAARGYRVRDFDAQADLVSVDYPGTVEDYRFAHAVQQRSQSEHASTAATARSSSACSPPSRRSSHPQHGSRGQNQLRLRGFLHPRHRHKSRRTAVG
jgi:hypothetical protein